MKTRLKYLEYKLTNELEENKKIEHEDLKEKEKHIGKLFAMEFGLKVITESLKLDIDSDKSKVKDKISNEINMKINSLIYSLMRSEENYKVKKTDRTLSRIWRYDGMITSLQKIREEIRKEF